jgi:lysylphosphatidylglycerol synthetase-like protein (DUF2156 family)
MRTLSQFIDSRVNSGLWALVVIVVVILLNSFLSMDLTVGRLSPETHLFPSETVNTGLRVVYLSLLILAVLFWLLDIRRRLYRVIFWLSLLCTLNLFGATVLLVTRLVQTVPVTVPILIRDGVFIFSTNILIFALWYWIIDSNNVRFFQGVMNPAWDFLFPQRLEPLPGYEDWTPRFTDYLFLAFTTSVAFSPTDTAPLSRTAKLLMIIQSSISLIVLSVIAGTAINMLSG